MDVEPQRKILPPPFYGAGIAISLAFVFQLYRLVTIVADNGETPFLSANDRSRWCTIATLMEDRSFIIDRLLEKRDKTGRKRTWYSIDMVCKPEADGGEHFYSSKPPLLSAMIATVGSPISVMLNTRLSDNPKLVGRAILFVVQVVPLLIFWVFIAKWIGREVDSDWARWSLLCIVLFGNFLSTFAITLNNHLPAAMCFFASLVAIRWQIASPQKLWLALLIGVFAGFTAAFELPALAWACSAVALLWVAFGWRHGLLAGIGAMPVGIAFLLTNWIAYGDLQPPYAHRELLGAQLASIDRSSDSFAPKNIAEALKTVGVTVTEPYAVRAARRAETFEFSAYLSSGDVSTKKANSADSKPTRVRFAVVPSDKQWTIHRWNDWYDYPKSYWLPENKQGVDRGEPSRLWYAFHVLIGHHGIFSLTPFWCLSLVGGWMLLSGRGTNGASRLGNIVPYVLSRSRISSENPIGANREEADVRTTLLVSAILVVSIVSIGFYLARPLIDRNYGGVSSGFRWQFWLIPAWLWLAFPAASYLGTFKFGRCLLFAMVALSLVATLYPTFNPWQHPWIYALVLRWQS